MESREQSSLPRVILSANVTHYIYAALALQRAGYLKRYIGPIVVREPQSQLASLLPAQWRRKLITRDVSGLDPERVRSLRLPELVQRGLPALGLASADRGHLANAFLYDRLARRWVDECDIFHFVSSVGLLSAQRARRQGSIIICDERQEYPDFQRAIVNEECEALGLSQGLSASLCEPRMKAEYAIADYLIVASNYVKRTFAEAGFPLDRIFVVPYGVDLGQFAPPERPTAPPDAGEPFRVLYVGNLHPRKGIHYLLDAFAELKAPDAELWLVGAGLPEAVEYYRRRASADPRIRLVGHVPKADLQAYYRQAAAFVLPSLADAYGLVVLEAMACGLPVIVTENCGSKEAVRAGVDGFIVPIRDPAAIRQALLRLKDDPAMRVQMGAAAAKRAREFTWERYGDNLMEAYAEILRNRETGGADPVSSDETPVAPDWRRRVQISITTRNRWPVLRETLAHLARLGIGLDVLIYDDGSDVPCPFDVAEVHPQARLQRFDESAGYLARRNQLMAALPGPFVLELDDDSYPVETGIEAALHFMLRRPETFALSFPIYNPIIGQAQLASLRPFPYLTRAFSGGAALIDREKFLELDGFRPELVFFMEESDLSARALKRGWVCYHYPALGFHHLHTPVSRSVARMDYYGARNNVLWNEWFVPPRARPWKHTRTLASIVIQTLRNRRGGHLKGYFAGWKDRSRHSNLKETMTEETYDVWRSLPHS